MAYRELQLDQQTKDELANYIESELLNHYAERGQHVEDLMRWQKDYWAKPTTEKATFPFTGAATIVIPLSAIAVEATHARVMTNIFGLEQFVTVSSLSGEWDRVAAPVEKFMNRELMTEMKIKRRMGDVFLEATKYGTGIGKTGYKTEVRTAVREEGGVEMEFDVVTRSGACFDAVGDARFLMPFAHQDPQTAPWVGQEHSAGPYEVESLEAGGMFKPGTIIRQSANEPSALESWVTTANTGAQGLESGKRFERNQQDLEKTQPQWPKEINWVELWLAWNVDGDPTGRKKEIYVHYHRESRTFMSIRYNYHHDLRRPYRMVVYMPVEHRGRGIGICKMNEQFQREVTVQHRQRLDNATLANMRMIVVNKLTGYGPREPVFPGKMWFVDDKDHITTLQMGEVYPSSYSNEQATLLYSQQRVGVGDLQSGQAQVGTPGTATSDLARIQEANKKFDFIFSHYRDFADEVVGDTICNIQQFGPRRVQYYDTVENGQMVKAFFDMPDSYVRDGLLLNIKTVGQQQNDIVDRQNWQMIAPILQQYYMGIIQLAMPLGDQQLLQTIFMRGLSSATEAARQFLESFPNVRNVDRLIVKELENVGLNGAAGAAGSQGAGLVPGAGAGVGGAGQDPRMELLAAAFSQLGANGNGGAYNGNGSSRPVR